MKKLEVDNSKCIRCGACYSMDDTHFAPDDEGASTVVSQDNIDDPIVDTAIESCPTGAISKKDE